MTQRHPPSDWLRDDGALVHDLANSTLDTRFLGDLYENLSEYARRTFALLQTPVFVEEFILDRTLEPALAERPLNGFRMIDPACGSGHFLLGGFRRLLDRWHREAPGLEPQVRVQQALDGVAGVDINPFAIVIARFRLLLAALQECGLASLENAPALTTHLAVGDTLIHAAPQGSHGYAYEDVAALDTILSPGTYDAVVGNPPYMTAKDKAVNETYRGLWSSCTGKYAMTVPFMQCFFSLAKPGGDSGPAGWVGQITSNSFMKRDFGSRLVEDFLAQQDLRLVVDTSGAYIPGHGTPTVIIVGRSQRPVGDRVRAVLGIRGEPGRPNDPQQGLVWTSIVEDVDVPGWSDEWVSVIDSSREDFSHHPWTLSGGGAMEVVSEVESAQSHVLGRVSASIGISSFTLADDVFVCNASAFRTRGVTHLRTMALGEGLRDWGSLEQPQAIWPYLDDFSPAVVENWPAEYRWMWPFRAELSSGVLFGGQSKTSAGLLWSQYGRLTPSKLHTLLSISFAFVGTHNHFVLDRGGTVFKQTAPIIKLSESASEEDHLALLGVLNSSTACFWLKQKSYPKGGDPVGQDGARVSRQPWSDRYEFTGTTLQDYPVPPSLPLDRGRRLDGLARRLTSLTPSAVAEQDVPEAIALKFAREGHETTRRLMIAEQEELDFEVYRLYGLLDDNLTYAGEVPEVALGERAFEIALARRVAAGEETTAWFARHGSTPITDIPMHWPSAYQRVVQRRLDAIESNPHIRLLEKPEYKRRWASDPWEKQQTAALRDWLLDRLEDRALWFDRQGRPQPQSVAQLADKVSRDVDLVSVLELWSGQRDVPVVRALTDLLADEAVPYLAAMRYKDTGLRTREAWEQTWALQRREDAGEDVGVIPVPPKFTKGDFVRPSYWQARGKLDVPKERFVSYPDAGRETDPTPLLGWAGWDHAQQALALALILQAREDEGWDETRFVPLVAGLAELLPWVQQWHSDLDPTYGVSPAEFAANQLTERMAQVSATLDDLAAWRPERARPGRAPRKA